MVTINASTTAGLVMTSDLSGVLTFQQGGVSLPNGGVAPAFSAYYTGGGQTIASYTFVKIIANTKEFDTNSNFDSTTNYRFTPTVAGYYQVNGQISFTTTIVGAQVAIFKNGAQFKNGNNPTSTSWATVSALIYLNGSTDYIELYVAQTSGVSATTAATSTQNNYFQACLVRGA